MITLPNRDRTYFIGVDLGQRASHTAIVLLERYDERQDLQQVLQAQPYQRHYVVRQADRIPLGTPYQDVVARLKAMVTRLNPFGLCVLVVDGTGIGIPIIDLMRTESIGCRILPIVITSGQAATESSVPRPALLTKMQVMAQRGELKVAAGCRDGEALHRELAHLTLDRGIGEHDDLAVALALACWRAKIR
jgi:hypothetical protein